MEKQITIEFSGNVSLVYKGEMAQVIDIAYRSMSEEDVYDLLVDECVKQLGKQIEEVLEGDDKYQLIVHDVKVE